ncbi:MAG: cbb3-type cytochrome c oxidase N-terminal domain-containing protein [Vulcanimicrobiota bacterium]
MAEVLDHEFDGIQEYDNPIPTWLGALFVITIVWGIGYALYYPSLPNFSGFSGWSAEQQYDAQMETEEARYAPLREEAEEKALEALASLSEDQATVQAGREVYTFYCAACHGDNAEGKVGPSLTDEEWLYGNEPKDILTSIREGRPKGMPQWKSQLKDDEVKSVAVYVMSLTRNPGEGQ